MTLQRKATVIASLVAGSLALIKLIVGLVGGSVAVLASAVDSLLDIFVSLFNFFALKKAEEGPTQRFNYGFGKIEAIAATLEGSVIFASGLFVFSEGVRKIVEETPVKEINLAFLVMIVSIILTGGLVVFLSHVSKKTGNLVVKSDTLHYKMDLLTNAAVLLSLVIVKTTGLNFVDGLFGLLVSLYIIYSAVGLIKEGIFILLDVSLDEKTVRKIEDIISSHPQVKSFHYLKTRRAGHVNFVDVHLVFSPDMKLKDAHSVADQIEKEIKMIDPEASWEVMIHLDPCDDSEGRCA